MKNGDLILHGDGYLDRGCVDACARFYGCRVIVTKERLEEQWPTDPEFRTFAAKLADAVQRALGEGKKVAPKRLGGECCPLGCLVPDSGFSYPPPACAPTGTEVNVWRAFYFGFDGHPANRGLDVRADCPYYRLGQAYRRRFTPASAS